MGLGSLLLRRSDEPAPALDAPSTTSLSSSSLTIDRAASSASPPNAKSRPSRLGAAFGLRRTPRHRDSADDRPSPLPTSASASASASASTAAPPLLPPIDLSRPTARRPASPSSPPVLRQHPHATPRPHSPPAAAAAAATARNRNRNRHKRLSAMSTANDRADRAAKRLSRQLDLLTAPARTPSPQQADENGQSGAEADLLQDSDLLQAVLGLSFGETDLPDGEAAGDQDEPNSSPRPTQSHLHPSRNTSVAAPAPSRARASDVSPRPVRGRSEIAPVPRRRSGSSPRPPADALTHSNSEGGLGVLGPSQSSRSLLDLHTPILTLGPGGTRCLRPDEAAELERQAQQEAEAERAVHQRMKKFYQSRSLWSLADQERNESDSDRSQDDYGNDEHEHEPELEPEADASMASSSSSLYVQLPRLPSLGISTDSAHLATSHPSATLTGLSSPSKRALYNCTLLKVHPTLADAVLATNAFEVLRASLGGGKRSQPATSHSRNTTLPSTVPNTPSQVPVVQQDLTKTAQGVGVVVVPSIAPLVFPRSMNVAEVLQGHESTLSSTRCLGVALARKRVMQRLIRPLARAHDVELGWFQRRYGSELIPSPLVAEAVAGRRATPEALLMAPVAADETERTGVLRRWTERPSFAERAAVYLPYQPSLGGEVHFLPDGSAPPVVAHSVAPASTAPLTFSPRLAALAHVTAPAPARTITTRLRKAVRHREWRPGAPNLNLHAPGPPQPQLTPAQQVSREYAKAQAARAAADRLQQRLSQRRPAPWSKNSHVSSGRHNATTTTAAASGSTPLTAPHGALPPHSVPPRPLIINAQQHALAPAGPQSQAEPQPSTANLASGHTTALPTSPASPPAGGYAAAYAAAAHAARTLAAQAESQPQHQHEHQHQSKAAHTPSASPPPTPGTTRSPSTAASPQSAQGPMTPAPAGPGPRSEAAADGKRHGAAGKLPPSSFKPVAAPTVEPITATVANPSAVTSPSMRKRAGTRSRSSSRGPAPASAPAPGSATPVAEPSTPAKTMHRRQDSSASSGSSGSRPGMPDPASAEGAVLKSKLQALRTSLLRQQPRASIDGYTDSAATGSSARQSRLVSAAMDPERGGSPTPRPSLSRASSRTRRAPSPAPVVNAFVSAPAQAAHPSASALRDRPAPARPHLNKISTAMPTSSRPNARIPRSASATVPSHSSGWATQSPSGAGVTAASPPPTSAQRRARGTGGMLPRASSSHTDLRSLRALAPPSSAPSTPIHRGNGTLPPSGPPAAFPPSTAFAPSGSGFGAAAARERGAAPPAPGHRASLMRSPSPSPSTSPLPSHPPAAPAAHRHPMRSSSPAAANQHPHAHPQARAHAHPHSRRSSHQPPARAQAAPSASMSVPSLAQPGAASWYHPYAAGGYYGMGGASGMSGMPMMPPLPLVGLAYAPTPATATTGPSPASHGNAHGNGHVAPRPAR